MICVDGNNWMHEATSDDLLSKFPNYSITCREYLCNCVSCLQFKFDECFKEQDASDVDFPEDLEEFEYEECDEYINQNRQFFRFGNVPSFVSLFTGNPPEPLFFVKVTEMRTKNYLKLTRSRSLNNKKFQILPACVLLPLDDAYDTYVEIDNDLQLNINIYNALVAKAHI